MFQEPLAAGTQNAKQNTILFCKWDKVLLQSLLDRNAKVVLVLDEFDVDNAQLDNSLLSRVAKYYRVSHFDSIDELSAVSVDLKLNGFNITKIVSPAEYSQYGAGLLAALFPGTNLTLDLAVKTRDKRIMKDTIQKAGIPSARFVSIPDYTDRSQRETAAQILGFPMVVKPANGLGTMTTKKIVSREALDEFLDTIQFEPAIHSKHLIAESFVSGKEYHIDALWSGTEPVLLSISEYHVPRLALKAGAGGNGSYILSREDFADLYHEVQAFNVKVNQALGIQSGITHMEVFREFGTNQLLFSEIATRYGGAAVVESLQSKFGADIREMYAAQLVGDVSLSSMPSPTHHKYVGWLNVAPSASGKIVGMPTEEHLTSIKGVLNTEFVAHVGDEIDLSHPSVWGIMLVLGADSLEGYHSLVDQVTHEAQISTQVIK